MSRSALVRGLAALMFVVAGCGASSSEESSSSDDALTGDALTGDEGAERSSSSSGSSGSSSLNPIVFDLADTTDQNVRLTIERNWDRTEFEVWQPRDERFAPRWTEARSSSRFADTVSNGVGGRVFGGDCKAKVKLGDPQEDPIREFRVSCRWTF